MLTKLLKGEMEGEMGMVMEVEGPRNLDRMGDVELHGVGYWDVSLCTGAGGSGGVGSSVGVNGTDFFDFVGVVGGDEGMAEVT